MKYIAKLNRVLKYGAKEAGDIQFNNPATEELALMAHNILHDPNGWYPLIDKLQEYDHPVVPILQRIITNNLTPIAAFNTHHIVSRSRRTKHYTSGIPTQYIFQQSTKTREQGITYDPKASLSLMYLNHPHGHFWDVRLRNLNSIASGITYRIPTNPEEVNHIANEYDKMGEHDKYFKEFADHLRRTLALEPGQVDLSAPDDIK